MTPSKRAFDVFFAVLLAVVLAPVALVIALVIMLFDGRPVFYVSERMKTAEHGFPLWKFRTMSVVQTDAGVSGGNKDSRITQTGRFLRKYRLDEIPQLWNILRGDISFVGPRPPLRHYVEKFPDIYSKVLIARPGLTGLATLVYHQTEERLLAKCHTSEETEEVYSRRCVPAKAKLDVIYARNQSVCGDFRIMLATVFRSLSLH